MSELKSYPQGKERGVTVVIGNRNGRPYLPAALDSALKALDRAKAEGFSGEVLVVDNGSLDGSQKLLRGVISLYNNPRLASGAA